jgi:hypothetical protein
VITITLNKDVEARIKAKVAAALKARLPSVMGYAWREILDWTPVNTGKMIANWHADAGHKYATTAADAIPIPPSFGPTNPLPLGEEERRSANEAQAQRQYQLTFDNPFDIFYIYNPTEYARDVELGTLPINPPFVVRNAPTGTVRRAMKATAMKYNKL